MADRRDRDGATVGQLNRHELETDRQGRQDEEGRHPRAFYPDRRVGQEQRGKRSQGQDRHEARDVERQPSVQACDQVGRRRR